MEKLHEENKRRSFTVMVPVKDWVEATEGTITFTVNGQTAHATPSGDSANSAMTFSRAHVRSKLIYKLTSKSVFNPGLPPGMPIPPGFPPELANPSLTVMDQGDFELDSLLSFDIRMSGICDPCKPEEGERYKLKIKYNDHATHTGVKVDSGYVFVGPMVLDRSSKTLKAKLMLTVAKAKLKWEKTVEGTPCRGQGETEDSGSKAIEQMPKQMFDVEIPFEEKDGMILVQKTLEVPFDYKIDTHKFPYKVPSRLNLALDLKIPLP